MGLALINDKSYDNSHGLNQKDSPTKLSPEDASLTLNMEYGTDGAFYTRNGSSITNPVQMDQLRNLALFDYKKSDGTQVNVIQNGSKIYHSLIAPLAAVTGLDATAIPDLEFQVTNDNEYLFWGNGVDTDLKFDGTTWTNWSIATPIAGMTATEVNLGAGNLPNGDYTYIIAYVRQDGGINVQYSDVSPEVTVTLVAGPSNVQLAAIPVSPDPQVTNKVIYRRSPNSVGVFYELATITNATAAYLDNTLADGTIEANFDNQPAPKTDVFEEYLGCMNIVDVTNRAFLYESRPDLPWNVPTENYEIFDGPVRCVKRVYGVLWIGTDRSIWVRNGRLQDGNVSKRISSSIGILNNRCADGLSYLYFIGSNRKFYSVSPTDFANEQIRLDIPLSRKIEPLFNDIGKALSDLVNVKYYTRPNVSKLMISAPIGTTENNRIIIFNETQASATDQPVWQVWDNIKANSMQLFTIAGDTHLYSGDNNGFLWKLDDETTNGDGAEINGTATSGTVTTLTENLITSIATAATLTTLTDATLIMTANQYAFDYIAITGGTGVGQTRQIISNNVDTFTVAAWGVTPDATSTYKVGRFPPNGLIGVDIDLVLGTGIGQVRTIISNTVDTVTISVGITDWVAPNNTTQYTIGGYDCYHFSNWKSVTDSYDTLKQLWFIFANLDSLGSYTIQLIIEFDFDEALGDAVILDIPLSGNAIWGAVIWGQFIWGVQRVFQMRVRQGGRFRAIRLGWRSQLAGQPFQCNGFTISAQDKKLFWPSSNV